MPYLRTLGSLALLERRSGPVLMDRGKPLLIPAVLAILPNHRARRRHLAELLWPSTDRQHAAASLRQAIHVLHGHGLDSALVASVDEMRIEVGTLEVDLLCFDDLIAARAYGDVVELYSGPFLHGFESTSSELGILIDSQNQRLQIGLEIAFSSEIARALAEGEGTRAVSLASRYADLNPLNEKAQVSLIETLKAAGDPVEALRALGAFRALLQGQLDDEVPEGLEEELVALIRREPRNSQAVTEETPAASPVFRRSRVVIWIAATVSVALIVWAIVASL